jgi:peptidyl-prolyl cis-trans isomerase B (cyclophilin B)
MEEKRDLIAVIETDKGKIRLKLFAEKVPVTVANFVNLAKHKFYDGLIFHRVIENFMIQGGCPVGDGTGGPGYQFEDEFVPELIHNKPGILSMANSGLNTNGSQFFITHIKTPWLDGKHTIFGEVVTEQDQKVVNNIVQNDKILSITIQGDTTELMRKVQSKLEQWNKILEQKTYELKS